MKGNAEETGHIGVAISGSEEEKQLLLLGRFSPSSRCGLADIFLTLALLFADVIWHLVVLVLCEPTAADALNADDHATMIAFRDHELMFSHEDSFPQTGNSRHGMWISHCATNQFSRWSGTSVVS